MLYTIHEDTKALRNKRNKMKFTCGKEHLSCEDQNSSENDLEQDNNLSEATSFFRRTPQRDFSYYLFFSHKSGSRVYNQSRLEWLRIDLQFQK